MKPSRFGRAALQGLLLGVALLLGIWIAIANPTFEAIGASSVTNVSPALLKKHVAALAEMTLSRNSDNAAALEKAGNYIRDTWSEMGLAVEEQAYQAGPQKYSNWMVSLGPSAAPRIVVGAHYDVCGDQPGADDNASGVAILLELTRLLIQAAPGLHRRIDLVAYSTEEPPYFASHDMGSFRHAKSLHDNGVKVVAMLSLEMLGFYSDVPGSQRFPFPLLKLFYPSAGNTLMLVGRSADWRLVREIKPLMQRATALDVRSVNAPASVQGIDWSDQRSYWEMGFPALMVTDTSYLRNPNYHQPSDTLSTLDFSRMAQAAQGVYGVVSRL